MELELLLVAVIIIVCVVFRRVSGKFGVSKEFCGKVHNGKSGFTGVDGVVALYSAFSVSNVRKRSGGNGWNLNYCL